VTIIAADHPFVIPDFLELLVKHAKGFDIVCPLSPDELIDPFLSVYRKTYLISAVKMLLTLDRFKSSNLIRGGRFVYLMGTEEIASVDPSFKSLININKPEDLRNLQHLKLKKKRRSSLTIRRRLFSIKYLENIRTLYRNNCLDSVLSKLRNFRHPFWKSQILYKIGIESQNQQFLRISYNLFLKEAEYYERRNLLFLQLQSLIDAIQAANALGSCLDEDVIQKVSWLRSFLGISSK